MDAKLEDKLANRNEWKRGGEGLGKRWSNKKTKALQREIGQERERERWIQAEKKVET